MPGILDKLAGRTVLTDAENVIILNGVRHSLVQDTRFSGCRYCSLKKLCDPLFKYYNIEICQDIFNLHDHHFKIIKNNDTHNNPS